ncbi:MAG: SpoIIE family protein phosphatase [Desulforhopalus sp.]
MLVGNLLLTQWGEMALIRLQRTAHQVDLSLRTPKDLLMLLQGSEDNIRTRGYFDHIIRQIESLEWVAGVNVEWPGKNLVQGASFNVMADQGEGHRSTRFWMSQFELSPPRYNSELNNRTVSMGSKFLDNTDQIIGSVEVIISFDQLIELVFHSPWWKSNKAYLLDRTANVLASTGLETGLEDYFPLRAFGTVNLLEQKTLAAMQKDPSGTVFGPGTPPEEISGFYHLVEAPWTMVVVAPGSKILQPVITFKVLYSICFGLCTLLILLFIRLSNSRVATAVKDLSTAAEDLTEGNFGLPLAVTTRDEVGELTKSFNKMTRHLKQRLAMKQAINVAREIQQNLLPQASFTNGRIVASGITEYCDETGGDYFDIINFPDNDRKVGVVVGDVVGHGIGAALLMTSVRALFRCRIAQPGSLGEVINDVNKMLYRDTKVSGNFVTLFYLEADSRKNTVKWVRCGHEPAIVYIPATGKFRELKGNGVALGVDGDWTFEYNEDSMLEEMHLICVASDGAWEIENSSGEQFGKKRLKSAIADFADEHPDRILKEVVAQIDDFRGKKSPNDDITLTVVKIGGLGETVIDSQDLRD